MAERKGSGEREVTEEDDKPLEMEPSKVYGAEHLLRLFGESKVKGKRRSISTSHYLSTEAILGVVEI
jgi:hypothetical protein